MRIKILGGGSAGWLAAAYLSKTNEVEIVVPEDSKTVGVGESTLPGLVSFLEYCGLSSDEILSKCDGIKKYDIKHHGWHNKDWSHPFPNNTWAYHLDALKLIDALEEVCSDRLTKVNEPDLVIDCTGFNSEYSKNKEFGTYQYLQNNMAIVGPGVSAKTSQTKTFAMDSGWMFNVDLQSRSGNGYIFNDKFISVDNAIEEFMQKNIANVKENKIRVVPIMNRFSLNPWQENVVSVGLSCGFVEPIEATGLFLITWAIETIEKLKNNPNREKIFNKAYQQISVHVYDFLDVFFRTSKNNHTEYWQHIDKIDRIPLPKTKLKFFRKEYSYKLLSDASGILL